MSRPSLVLLSVLAFLLGANPLISASPHARFEKTSTHFMADNIKFRPRPDDPDVSRQVEQLRRNSLALQLVELTGTTPRVLKVLNISRYEQAQLTQYQKNHERDHMELYDEVYFIGDSRDGTEYLRLYKKQVHQYNKQVEQLLGKQRARRAWQLVLHHHGLSSLVVMSDLANHLRVTPKQRPKLQDLLSKHFHGNLDCSIQGDDIVGWQRRFEKNRRVFDRHARKILTSKQLKQWRSLAGEPPFKP